MAGSFFEKLTRDETNHKFRVEEDDSIRNHLLRLLTTREGSAQTVPDYGLPDLNNLHLSKSELLHFIARSIQECIKKYEPRLCDVYVKVLPIPDDSINLLFSIEAKKISENGQVSDWKWNVTLNNTFNSN